MKNTLLNYMSGLENHPVFDNDYFKLLKTEKLTPPLYASHRANFFFRTMATVMGIAHICANAAQNHDQDTLILFSYILNEECGNGDKSQCHELLMEQSHNMYGQLEFDLPPLRVKDAEASRLNPRDDNSDSLIIDETRDYRSKINALLTRNYPTMLGVAYALETHASIMLTNFRDMFSFNRSHMDKNEYTRKVEIYFNCHLDSGVEDRHAADAQQCVVNNCVSESALADIMYGIDETLKIQHAMWNGMHRKAVQILNA
ncbi:iron-containing redox enzyme family protein [Janthinobacterium fluminis]|uniref:Iron-containing redox enzyme family protein n=1 Tax=Janthinobacterium fluminis TaxID=2987524 RepID=A0ABT5K765_9BURK|nr:iron-containing redox enzyme family protein [Janthinobacterium fluminis]MDC8759597.1 iron-containing redox enzyme family protein [Janthinobacterium fluminis]